MPNKHSGGWTKHPAPLAPITVPSIMIALLIHRARRIAAILEEDRTP
ncbi:hypothetical protein [Sorangium sp. So ce204]